MIGFFNQLFIQANAIGQPLDLTVPEQGLMLAVYLSIPEAENQRRSLNVISIIRRSFKDGRYVRNAPKGYSRIHKLTAFHRSQKKDKFKKIEFVRDGGR